MSVVPNGDIDREDGFESFFFTDELTETEEDGFANEDVELPELEAFPYSDGDDTEDEFASISKTVWLRTTELDDFLNEDVEVLDLNKSLYVDLVEEDLPNGDGIEDGSAAFFFPSRLADGKVTDGDSTGEWFWSLQSGDAFPGVEVRLLGGDESFPDGDEALSGDGLGEEDNPRIAFPSGTIFKWMEEGMMEKTIDVNAEETEVEINYY